ncbi:Ketoacyl-synthetase C-terminal extension [Clostridium cavendishii DSM 21758]|uniref:Ketoacyl-synthetase C-terminal extension n=1 Tax=Clostridium cavendishii DSM 21758 TaxID=1121302 RepID=A0A1M6MSI5_9CLOT|nr:beta-ketoacyl synthase N-terminal-like domain-containing protein [Clostridium cavendishii]SHJ86431.1 Ketoacyl-synthetase C-terminal extension [Clostridium cavendishii DSM 21758]
MDKVKKYILSQIANENIPRNDAKEMLKEFIQSSKTMGKKVEEDIAIIGMAGKYPASDNLEKYWYNLKNGINCVSHIPEQRREDSNVLYSLFISGQGKMVFPNIDTYHIGGYLNEIDKFDASFFQIPPNEAKAMDPFQRLFLETVYNTIEEAGYAADKLSGENIGIFAGRDHTVTPYYKLFTSDDHPMKFTGSLTSIMTSRISYIFNFKGPSMVIDTSCSSGLVAVHEACKSLCNHECSMAIAGGISLDILPATFNGMSMITSSVHKVQTFSEDADGTIFSEGVGAILLKPLKIALMDGDHIHAIIKGSAVNNVGATSGLATPSRQAEEELLISAWKDAKIEPESISYVEAHGSATSIGDPIEIKAITSAFRRFSRQNQFCAIGTSKSNIGHTAAASGIASLTKVILSIKNEIIPPSINFIRPNKYVDFTQSAVYINDKIERWKTKDKPRRAGVSSFGFSGTNCHVVVEEAPMVLKENGFTLNDIQESYIFLLSAKSIQSLFKSIENYNTYLVDKNDKIEDICYTSAVGRNHYNYRLAIIIKTKDELIQIIKSLLSSIVDIEDYESKIFSEKLFWGDYKSNIHFGFIKEINKNLYSLNEIGVKENIFTNSFCYEVCKAYVNGAMIEWKELYKGYKYNRVSLPLYPFFYKRYWFEPDEVGVEKLTVSKDIRLSCEKVDGQDRSSIGKTLNKKDTILIGKSENIITPIEKVIGNIWGKILGFEEVNVNDHFYNLGGSSILAIRLIENINVYFNTNITIKEFLEYPTVFELSLYVSSLSISNQELNTYDNQKNKEENKNEAESNTEDNNLIVPVRLYSLNHLNLTNNYTWSQLDCYERGIAIQCEKIDFKLINYFNFMVGVRKGFNLSKLGYSNFELQDKFKSNENLSIVDEVLQLCGLKVKAFSVSQEENVCERIAQIIDKEEMAMVLFDEYYIFYSNFYKIKHTDHLTIVNGYDKKRELFNIVNHNHMEVNLGKEISYSTFSVSFDVMEEIYRERSAEYKKVLVIDPIEDKPISTQNIKEEYLRIINYIAKSLHKGSALDLLEQIIRDEDNYFLEKNLNKLYLQLGGLELTLKCILRSYNGPNYKKIQMECSQIVKLAGSIIDRYSISVFRKKMLNFESLSKEFDQIQNLINDVFNTILTDNGII